MDLSDVERDAARAAETLAGLGKGRTVVEHLMADEGRAAAERVLAYLRTLRRPGDGAAAVAPIRLGPWRDWCPPRGHLVQAPPVRVPRRTQAHGHGDPGE